LTKTVLGAVRAVVMVIAASVAANQLLFSPSDILLSVTVFSAVLGLVLAPIIGSVINGLFLLADQPYEIGDMIEFVEQDRRGYVEDITLRYTKVFTLENSFLVIPNSNMRDRDIINYSAEDTRSRLSMEMLVTYFVWSARSVDTELGRRHRSLSPVTAPGVVYFSVGGSTYPGSRSASAPASTIRPSISGSMPASRAYSTSTSYWMPAVETRWSSRSEGNSSSVWSR
jgi:hypothetical protein